MTMEENRHLGVERLDKDPPRDGLSEESKE